MTERFNSGKLKNIFRFNFHKFLNGRMIVGKHAWQQEEDQKGYISNVLILQKLLNISELFKGTQDAI